jgi:hypothetical protein
MMISYFCSSLQRQLLVAPQAEQIGTTIVKRGYAARKYG